DLVDADGRRELTGTALDQFRSNYLASPLRREKVKFAQAFQLHSERAASFEINDRTEMASCVTAKSGWPAWFKRQMAIPPALQRGLALGALTLLMIGGWLAFDNVRLRRQLANEEAAKAERFRHEQDLQARLNNQRSASLQ